MNNLKESEDNDVRVRYDLLLKVSDIDLVEKCVEASCQTPIYIDPLYLVIVKEYMDMLGISEGNTVDISEETKIRKTLEKCRETNKNAHIYFVSDPVDMIKKGINAICDVIPYYITLKEDSLVLTIKELRRQTGLSQTEFAKKFHINKGTLTNWEQGLRNPPEHVQFMIETILMQEKAINNIYARIKKEKYKDRSQFYSEEICQAKKNAFSMVIDIVEEELWKLQEEGKV